MPRTVRMEWGNLTEDRQESFVSALIHILQGLCEPEHRANFRTVRQGCDAHKCKELQFLEPTKLEQFLHIGKAIHMFQTLPPNLTNLAYTPFRFHLANTVAGNSVDRDFLPYSVCISIRNATVTWKQENAMYALIGKLFPAMLGALISPLIGKTYIIGEDGQTYRNNVWYLRIHGKMAEWIFATGKTSLTDEMPLENHICFEEQYPDKLLFCSQCMQWGNHQEIEGGLAGCSAPGTCSLCCQNTSRSLYRQHEQECKKTLSSIKCAYCKDQADFHHDPSQPGNCDISHKKLISKIKKMEDRQDSYNIRFISDIVKRIHIKGGDLQIIMTARQQIWKGPTQTAAHSLITGMDLIPSHWDPQSTNNNAGTYTLHLPTHIFCSKSKKLFTNHYATRGYRKSVGCGWSSTNQECRYWKIHMENQLQRTSRRSIQRKLRQIPQGTLWKQGKILIASPDLQILLLLCKNVNNYNMLNLKYQFQFFSEKCALNNDVRNTTALITKAHLEAGDLELNPGPPTQIDIDIHELLFTVDSHNPEPFSGYQY